jgi:hypothetical protein
LLGERKVGGCDGYHVAEMRKTRSAYKILMAKSLEKDTTGKTKDMEQNIEIDLRETFREAGTWREMSQNQVQEHTEWCK